MPERQRFCRITRLPSVAISYSLFEITPRADSTQFNQLPPHSLQPIHRCSAHSMHIDYVSDSGSLPTGDDGDLHHKITMLTIRLLRSEFLVSGQVSSHRCWLIAHRFRHRVHAISTSASNVRRFILIFLHFVAVSDVSFLIAFRHFVPYIHHSYNGLSK